MFTTPSEALYGLYHGGPQPIIDNDRLVSALIERQYIEPCPEGYRLTLVGYYEVTRRKATPNPTETQRVARALEDLETFREIKPITHSAIVRDLIIKYAHDDEVQAILWETYKTDGGRSWLHKQYPDARLSPEDREDIAYYTLLLLLEVAPDPARMAWNPKDDCISLRYPTITRRKEKRQRQPNPNGDWPELTLHGMHREVYCDGVTETTKTFIVDGDGTDCWMIPDLPYVQYYADPWARVPLRTAKPDYALKTLEYDEAALVLDPDTAETVVAIAERICGDERQYADAKEEVKHAHPPVPPHLVAAVTRAIETQPYLPEFYGTFDTFCLNVVGDDAEYIEVCWTNFSFTKSNLTVERIENGKVRVI